ncbi:MAG: WecB/TagA/CpsF family glycosyltransferase [Candidatus Kerfeldbacteria bacterium]|nr:WecB/TagA/CpsF family glycosyltransferase [Candidatus Kerfeldbacteria bacterium]
MYIFDYAIGMNESQHKAVFGVPIDDISLLTLQEGAEAMLQRRHLLTIATLNPEIMLEVKKDPQYARIVQAHMTKIVDGFGLQLLGNFSHRVSGVECAEMLMRVACAQKLKVAFIVRADGLSTPEEVTQIAHQRFSSATVRVFLPESAYDEPLQQFDPHIVLVGLGFPHQERWVIERGSTLTPHSIILCVGGTFDYWTGAKPRAPKFFQKIGMEWLWRLIVQPSRILRIFRAVVVFPCMYLFSVVYKNKNGY